jgi:hypothetical protein
MLLLLLLALLLLLLLLLLRHHLEDEGRLALVSAVKDSASAGQLGNIVGPGKSSIRQASRQAGGYMSE